jgi:ribosomal protein L24
MKTGDIVVVIDSKSVPSHFFGHYGKIVNVNEEKVTVEFVQRIGTSGSLSHTAYPSDLIKVGKVL